MATSKNLVAEINDILDDYYQLVRDEFEGAAKDMAEECVVRLKAVRWKTDTGKDYSSTWKMKKMRWGSYKVYNEKNYRLTHLLENGHIAVNGKGVVGRARAHKHIYPVYAWAQAELEHEIRSRIERGN